MGRVQTAPHTQSHSSPQSAFELKSSRIGSCWLCEVTQSWKPAVCVSSNQNQRRYNLHRHVRVKQLQVGGVYQAEHTQKGNLTELQRWIDLLSTINLITDYSDDWIIFFKDKKKSKCSYFSFLNVKMFWFLGNILGVWKKQDI